MIAYLKCLFTGHQWRKQFDANVFEGDHSRRPVYIKRVFICEKCLSVKRVHL